MLKTILVLAACAVLSACQGLTVEQKAEVAYGSFVTAEKAAAQAIASPEISDGVKHQIQVADTEAKPPADALEAALLAYRKNKDNADALTQALNIAAPAIAAFAGVVP